MFSTLETVEATQLSTGGESAPLFNNLERLMSKAYAPKPRTDLEAFELEVSLKLTAKQYFDGSRMVVFAAETIGFAETDEGIIEFEVMQAGKDTGTGFNIRATLKEEPPVSAEAIDRIASGKATKDEMKAALMALLTK